MHWAYRLLPVAMILGACAPPKEPIPITPPGETAAAPVVRRTLPEPAPPQVASVEPGVPSVAGPPPMPPIVVPAGALYVCVSESGGQRQQTAIEFSPKVAELCRNHPEMGPCQYERDVCRRSGGRVYAANDVEITKQTEAEYDKKVMRVRFKSN
jgi:hypothetical protein